MSFINDDAKVKNGGRKAKRISIEEFKNKIWDMPGAKSGGDEIDSAVFWIFNKAKYGSTLKKDNKYKIDFENVDIDDDYYCELGFHTTDEGLTYCGIIAGGDWEAPVFSVLYWDGKTVRMYTPTYGNYVNTIEKCAIGSEGEHVDSEDFKDKYKKKGGWDDESDEPNYLAIYGIEYEDYEFDKCNWDAIKQDFMSRIEVID